MKIKNIVFDLGAVLIDFKPQVLLKKIGLSDEEVDLFNKIIFYGEEWRNYNSSINDINETILSLTKRYPEYADKIKFIFDNFDYKYILFLMEDTSLYLKELKGRGYNIYLLSDLSADSFIYNKSFDFFNYIDGGIYSFEIGSTKPNKKNYEELLKRYNLVAEETIFIDDNYENIKAANTFGIKAVQFTNLEEVKTIVEKFLDSK